MHDLSTLWSILCSNNMQWHLDLVNIYMINPPTRIMRNSRSDACLTTSKIYKCNHNMQHNYRAAPSQMSNLCLESCPSLQAIQYESLWNGKHLTAQIKQITESAWQVKDRNVPPTEPQWAENHLSEPISLNVINKQTKNYSCIHPTQQTCKKICITSTNSMNRSISACCWREPQTNELRKCAKTHLHFTKRAQGKMNGLL